MGRQRSIDRDKVLDTAEEIVATRGAAGLTIDAVAKAMGISKGGVQYCFGSKDALIDAMFDRWGSAYETLFTAIAGDEPSPQTAVRAHMLATHSSDQTSSAKAAGLMATLIQTPEHLASTREWYRSRIAGLDLTTEEGKRARGVSRHRRRLYAALLWFDGYRPGGMGNDVRRYAGIDIDGRRQVNAGTSGRKQPAAG